MNPKNTGHIKQYPKHQWDNLPEATKAKRIKALNTLKSSSSVLGPGEPDYYTSRSGDTEVLKRAQLLGKKPKQSKGAKRERVRAVPRGLGTDNEEEPVFGDSDN